MADEFKLVEDFFLPADGGDVRQGINRALTWSGANQLPVYAFHNYPLAGSLQLPANAALIATPTARFIRGFGGQTNGPGTSDPLVQTMGGIDQPNIRIQGGLWGNEVDTWTAAMTFTAGASGFPNTIAFTGARARFFSGVTLYPARSDVLQQIWVYKKDVNRDYDPAVINNNRIFAVTGWVDADTLKVTETPTSGAVSGMAGSYVPLAGNGFAIRSTGGVIDRVGLLTPRGIQFQLQGDGFVLTRSWSRNPTPDSGGGVRFAAGRGMRGSQLDLESSDDCFQFNPSDNDQATVEQSSIVDSLGRTNQGALIAFINGNGRAYIDADSATSLRDCSVRNIRGSTGGSALHGGVAIKIYCANSSKRLANCWVEDVYVRQSDVTPPDTLRAGVMIVTGRVGGGVVNSGVRNLVVENRSGPLLAIAPADNAPSNFSKTVEFTVEQARGAGKGTLAGAPLITAPYADRLVLRDVTGDLSGGTGVGDTPGRALEIGVNYSYASSSGPATIGAGPVKDLVVDGCATDNAALPPTGGSGGSGGPRGIWQFGNVAKADVRRLSTKPAAGAAPVGGIELVQAAGDPGPTWCRFAQVDFGDVASGYEIAAWRTQVGNRIEDSIGFDDRTDTVTLASGAVAVAPVRFAPTIVLSLASGSAAITSMTPPGIASPRCTLLVPGNVMVSSGTGAGAFVMGTPLSGGGTASITFQWRETGNRWREVARTA